MNKKLILTLSQDTLKKAEQYAEAQGKSLSTIVQNYLEFLVIEPKNAFRAKPSERVARLRGILKVGPDFDENKILDEERTRRLLD